jgi:hypothetical protein
MVENRSFRAMAFNVDKETFLFYGSFATIIHILQYAAAVRNMAYTTI